MTTPPDRTPGDGGTDETGRTGGTGDTGGMPEDPADFRHLGGVRPRGSTEAEQVEVERTEAVVVTWADGHVSRFPLVPLRRSCTCATCRHVREQGGDVWPRPGAPEALEIVHAELTGGWGLALEWNDGHTTGIYAWDVLRVWCPCEECRSADG